MIPTSYTPQNVEEIQVSCTSYLNASPTCFHKWGSGDCHAEIII